jgi:HEAT repeat protein
MGTCQLEKPPPSACNDQNSTPCPVKWLRRSAVVLVVCLLAVLAVPQWRYGLLGQLRGEPYRDGHPVTYWAWLVEFGDDIERMEAQWTLSGFGKPAVPYLMNALQHAGPQARANVATALAEMARRGPLVETIPDLLAALHDSDAQVRARVVEVLGLVGRSRAEQVVPPLKERLEDPDIVVRLHAERALAWLGAKGE